MSVIGSPLETAALQAIQAQQVASKARDREKAQSATGRRFEDLVELRVSGTETTDAVRALPQNNSEQERTEHESTDAGPNAKEDRKKGKRIDLKA